MLGAIIGDIVGSRFEGNNYRSKDFIFFTKNSHYTDDTIMTVAIAKAILRSKLDRSNLSEKAVYYMRYYGHKYSNHDYGGMFNDCYQQIIQDLIIVLAMELQCEFQHVVLLLNP